MQNYVGVAQGIVASPIVPVTAVASINFAIPVGVRKITVIAVATNSPTNYSRIQLVDTVAKSAGYISTHVRTDNANGNDGLQITTGLLIPFACGVSTSGQAVLIRGDSGGWTLTGIGQWLLGTLGVSTVGGYVVLSGALTAINIAPTSGNWIAGGTLQLLFEY